MIFPNRLFDQYGLWAYGGRIDYEHHWNNNENYTSLEMVEKEPLKKMYKFADQRDFYITHSSVSKMYDFMKQMIPLNNHLLNGKSLLKAVLLEAEIDP